ncbi:hypothetical protein a10_09326 [Streptomyces acidiscabies]|nr:hypothetical protein a10_09326 [Streptomyces acidiscabies]GAV46263.1 hypothetical protein Saa2_09265 [Streptomyces acidiscabies]
MPGQARWLCTPATDIVTEPGLALPHLLALCGAEAESWNALLKALGFSHADPHPGCRPLPAPGNEL